MQKMIVSEDYLVSVILYYYYWVYLEKIMNYVDTTYYTNLFYKLQLVTRLVTNILNVYFTNLSYFGIWNFWRHKVHNLLIITLNLFGVLIGLINNNKHFGN